MAEGGATATDDETIAVLLIEDDPAIREMYELRLVRDGYRVTTAEDGEAGLARAAEDQPDIIFLDIRMPRKDGFQVLAELRSNPETAAIPVVILSNYGERDLVQRGLSLGALEYLVKSHTTPGALSSSIEEWIGR